MRYSTGNALRSSGVTSAEAAMVSAARKAKPITTWPPGTTNSGTCACFRLSTKTAAQHSTNQITMLVALVSTSIPTAPRPSSNPATLTAPMMRTIR